MFRALFFCVLGAIGLAGLVPLEAGALIYNPYRLSRRDRLGVELWLAKEDPRRVLTGHASRVHLVRDGFGMPEKTPYSVLIISGLFNSPESMSGLVEHFAGQRMNVVNMRLAGHYETDASALSHAIEWEQWKKQTDEALDLAQRLGDKVILVGHSTGALLLTWAAFERPESVAGLALFSPAFMITPGSLFSAMISKTFGLNPTVEGRLIAGHAGLEVQKMAAHFRSLLQGTDRSLVPDSPDFAPLAERLQHVPVWVANTALDVVIDVRAADRFVQALSVDGAAPRFHYSLPACELVLHDRIVSPRNSSFVPMLKSMSSFLPSAR